MPISLLQYGVIISCPSDVRDEISVISSTLEKFNRQIGTMLGVRLEPKHWSRDVFISHGSPQKLINEQIVKSSDIIIAVFNQKLGTPTEQYDSGTLEEIALMIESGKQVFVCFSDKPIKPSQIDYDNRRKVDDFRKKYAREGLYLSYDSDADLNEQLFNQLSLYLQSVCKDTATKAPQDDGDSGGWGQTIINHGSVVSQYNAKGNMEVRLSIPPKEK